MWTIIWLVVLILTVVIEFCTLGLTSIWFSGAAVVAIALSLFDIPWYFQLAAFILVSILLLVLTRPIAVKYFNNRIEKTNADGIIGQSGLVFEEINNIQTTGRIRVNGQDWSARSADPEAVYKVNQIVKVVSIDGVKAIVEAIKEQEE